MKRITLLLFMLFSAFCGYSQLAQEGFEGTWPPTGWAVYNNGSGMLKTWVQSPGGIALPFPAYDGTYSAVVDKENVPDTNPAPQDWLVTPEFTVPANPQLRFFSRLGIPGDQGSLYRIMVTTDPDASDLAAYTQVMEWEEGDINPTQTEYMEIILPLDGLTAGTTVRLAFVLVGDDGDRWLIDNVSVSEQCIAPENLLAENATLDTAHLTWDAAGATQWEVEVLPVSEPSTGSGVTVTGTAEYDPALLEDTDYKFFVKAVCEEGVNESEWAGPYYFSTVGLGDTCNAPLEITALPFSTTDNTSNYGDDYSGTPGLTCVDWEWQEYLNGDDVVYSYTAAADGTISVEFYDAVSDAAIFIYDSCDDIGVNCLDGGIFPWDETPVEIPLFPVTAGTTYYFVISSWGPWPQATPYTLVIQEVHCEKPVGLPTTSIGLTTADLSWTNPSGATSWEYVVQAPGSGVPTGAGETADSNTNFTVDDLTQATPYEYYVRADCGDGTFSAWAGPYYFNTMVCEVADQCTLTFTLTSQWGGFDDNTMNVSQNGVVLAVLGPDFTWEDGTGPVEVEVQVCNGIPVDLFWNAGGWSNQVGVSITNSFNQVMYEKPIGTGSSGTLLYSGMVDCDNPLCIPPTSLTTSNETMTTADLSWLGTDPGQWEYYIVEAGEPAPTDATDGEPTDTNPVTADGLEPATNYEYYVRYVCSDTENSAWAGPYAFNTEVCDESEKCLFTFEMTSQGGWGWEQNTMLISQGGVPIATLAPDFWGFSDTVQIPLCPDVDIEVFWNEGGWTPDDKGLVIYSPFAEDVYTMEPGTQTQGTVVIAGPVSCDPPPCPKPQNLTATDLQLNSALLGWDEMGSADTWEIWVLPYGSPAPTEPGEVTNDNPYLADGLTSGTPYVFYVRANCGEEDGYSTWSGPYVFTTAISNDFCDGAVSVPVNPGIDCDEITSGTLTGATSSGQMASCNWQAPTYDVWYSFVATEATHSVSLTNMNGGFFNMSVYEGADCASLTDIYCNWDTATTISGLTPGETYYIQVFADWLDNPAAPTSFDLCVVTPASIVADNTTYSVEELVTEVLITSECASVSNITWSTGTSNDWGGQNGIAMFEKGMSAFPMQKGVILATGNAMSAPGPNTNTLSEGFWPGDDDLLNYITESGIDPNLNIYNDATVLEFDFVPLTNHISFPFVFASEEYGIYQCDFSDAFAFFLTDITDGGETENLAVIPGTDIPVSVVTIRNSLYNDFCGSANEEYFDAYYDLGDMSAAINYNGNTVQMAAQADVVMGNTYHIKLVIADRNDTAMDSAVFIGPFDIGQINLGDDLIVENGTALCEGGEYVLDSNINPDDYEITWTHTDANGVVTELEGTGSTVVVTEPGTYTISATYLSSTCIGNDSVLIEYFPSVNDAVDLFACDSSGFDTFDLSQNDAVILAGFNAADYQVTYYLTEEDAMAQTNAVDMMFTNTVQFGQPLFARVEGLVTGCVAVKPFNVVVEDNPPTFTVTDSFSICEGASGTITVTPIDFDPADVEFSWTLDGEGLPDSGASIIATEGGIYEVTVNNNGCVNTEAIEVTVVPMPVADVMEDFTSCGAYTLPALSDNNAYYTGPGATGEMLAVGTEIAIGQTIYIYASTAADFGDCSDENSFTVTVVPAPEFEVTGDCINNEFVLQVNFLDEMYNEGNVTFEWTDANGAPVSSDSSVVATMAGVYQVTVIPSEYEESCPFLGEFEVENPNCLIPRGISPNNDDMNDAFDLTGFNVSKLSIFNRYGQEVYSKTDYTNEWYGLDKHGKELPTGTYFYSMERANGDNRTGWVYINREVN
ncbi:T9SS type B sorting domain-containing protein [Flavobacterium alkalisoli]|uniref:T9SS type B sorting domain-containing protein n=1 Tax=Flavobacterium alkalisoli TaxID=2602769 RepID=A0A5B9FU60_9FLAO|nr:choice-of-anchor L domain-containing protein [Flavobacterium alkalisoli]QEE48242.1 T9SS type B sorting domain-containing protein [Flavobacterium alkalisoli]